MQLLVFCGTCGIHPPRQVLEAAVGVMLGPGALARVGATGVMRLLRLVQVWGAGVGLLRELLPAAERVLEVRLGL